MRTAWAEKKKTSGASAAAVDLSLSLSFFSMCVSVSCYTLQAEGKRGDVYVRKKRPKKKKTRERDTSSARLVKWIRDTIVFFLSLRISNSIHSQTELDFSVVSPGWLTDVGFLFLFYIIISFFCFFFVVCYLFTFFSFIYYFLFWGSSNDNFEVVEWIILNSMMNGSGLSFLPSISLHSLSFSLFLFI